MKLLCGQSNRVWHYWAGRYPGSVGLLIGPAYFRKVPLDPWMPFALDNDAYTAWRDGLPWDEYAWIAMLDRIRSNGKRPLWAAVPDVVGNREATLRNWPLYYGHIKARGWPMAFCVQDGMTPEDVPDEADVVFVGGTDDWKFRNLPRWTNAFRRVHCARVNAPEMIERCEQLGCESVDGTGWFREPSRDDKVPALERFIEGHRNKNLSLELGAAFAP